jgi:hypothetical protein
MDRLDDLADLPHEFGGRKILQREERVVYLTDVAASDQRGRDEWMGEAVA